MVFKSPLSLLLILLAMGCSKSPQIQREEPDVIQEARYYFEKNVLAKNVGSNARIEGSFTHGDPRWDDATTRQLSRGTIVQVPLSVDSMQGVTFENHVLPLRYKDYLLIYKDKDSIYRNIVMRNIRTGSGTPGFSGITMLQDWQGANPSSFAMEAGKIVMPDDPTARKAVNNSLNTAAISCVTITYWYSVNDGPWQLNFTNTVCLGGGGPADGGSGSGGPGEWQELPPEEGAGGGLPDPSQSVEPPPVVIIAVKDGFKSPCFSSTLVQLTMTNLTNAIAQLLRAEYQYDRKIDLTFKDSTFSNGFHDGVTEPRVNESGDQKLLTLEVSLNTAIANGSREYIAATIMHEILHGYFVIEYNRNNNPFSHGQMAGTEFFNKMIGALKELFPNLSTTDANALVWMGLDETPEYSSFSLNEKNQIESIALNYRTGLSGTKCNQ
ncbi:hypothetical protein [Chitinophaga sp. sic0106]|uniref:hypothetical protein n=1 Tax=Chitinophaga sp. sic0106 TaxID=2854785 RepID=UPI001C464DCE|nr:hypothetical protein [Chitinophaga sp. sic0106]MBV7531099.1 hypothetical protein [Chitinophaga sp. sic0106]